jgi:formate dehydrogenase major subunit
MIHVTIDDKKLEVPQGTTVLRAAHMAGIHIPTLCDHPHLVPHGGCRLCLVEVEGARTLQPSCTLPATNGMVVHTSTPRVREARKFVLSLLFSERNHFCMYCQMSDNDCELQGAAYGEDMTHWPLQPNWQSYPVDSSHEYLVVDHNRCILCRRCVRACGELVGNFTLGMSERGSNTMLMADLNVPIGESTCVSCGTCAQVCPTGAIIDRFSAYRGREKDVTRVKSTCVGCSVGCGVELVVRDNHLLRIEGDWDAPVNGGVLCRVGRYQPMEETRERVVTPLVRKNGALKAATWDEALDYLVEKLKPLAGENGDGLAALASTRLPSEALHLFKTLFADKFGSQMVTSIEEGRTVAVPGQVAAELGRPFEGKLEAIKSADCVVAVGVDLADSHQVAGFFVKRSLPQGAKLIVIDAYENGLDALADHALHPHADTDRDLLLGIASEMVSMHLAKGEAENPDRLAHYTAEAVSETTGVPASQIRAVAEEIAACEKPAFVYGKGITAHSAPQTLKALITLARLAGAYGTEKSGIVGIKGQANSTAAYFYGLDKPLELNGHQAVFLAVGDDKISRRLLERLEKAPFVAVSASYLSAATDLADVVLPVEMWAEQSGHYLNLEGRLQETHAGLTPPPDTWANVKVLEAIAARTGFELDGDWQQALHNRVPTTLAAN